MPIRSLLFTVCAAVALSTAAVAADAPDKCPPRPGFAQVAPEQRLMMFADMKVQADSGAVDPQILRQMQRDKLKAMTEDQRKAYFADLSKRWAALPPAKQKEVKADAEAWRAEHPRPEGRGPEGRRSDCPHPEH